MEQPFFENCMPEDCMPEDTPEIPSLTGIFRTFKHSSEQIRAEVRNISTGFEHVQAKIEQCQADIVRVDKKHTTPKCTRWLRTSLCLATIAPLPCKSLHPAPTAIQQHSTSYRPRFSCQDIRR